MLTVSERLLRKTEIVDRTGVQAAKLLSRNAGRAQFLHNCPQQYDEILTMIDALVFSDEPKYDQIRRLLNEVGIRYNTSLNGR
uniref:Uncharacterized protein n=1 Tax=Parascaris equorum TaxID=6256 RepID=A0A914R3Y9_PAREQ